MTEPLKTTDKTLSVTFKHGVRPDGEVEYVTIDQHGYGELRLTVAQAKSLMRVLVAKFGLVT